MADMTDPPKRYFDSEEQFQKFLEIEKEWMYNRILDAINLAYEWDFDEAYIMEAHIDNSSAVIKMNSPIEEWEKSLTLSMKWFEIKEKYEKCLEIQKLIANIKEAIIKKTLDGLK